MKTCSTRCDRSPPNLFWLAGPYASHYISHVANYAFCWRQEQIQKCLKPTSKKSNTGADICMRRCWCFERAAPLIQVPAVKFHPFFLHQIAHRHTMTVKLMRACSVCMIMGDSHGNRISDTNQSVNYCDPSTADWVLALVSNRRPISLQWTLNKWDCF